METEYNLKIKYCEKSKEWIIDSEDVRLRYKSYKKVYFEDVFKTLFKKKLE
jgi:uncharacterized protein YqkB